MKFLLMSGNPSRGQGGWDLLDPGVPFLAKPWTMNELRDKVAEALAGQARRADA